MSEKALYAYVGSRTTRERHARGDGISVYRLNTAQTEMTLMQVVGDLVNPSFLVLNRAGDRLYTVHGDGHEVSAFCVDTALGTLRFLNRQDCGGKNPVHLALDPSGRYVVVSNHLSGTLAVLPLGSDGALLPLKQLAAMAGEPGPHRVEQPFAKPHFNPFDPSGRFVVVPDKGLDRLFSFRFKDGALEPTDMPSVATREAAGPRHLAFHPKQPFAYVVNELDSTLTMYRFEAQTGALTPLQILSALPDTFIGNNRASEIAIDAEGRVLYASNRGDDSIAVFQIDAATGRLTFVGTQASGGRTPRYFALTPAGNSLFVLNEDSDNIVGFSVDSGTGQLAPSGFTVTCGSPVCLVFFG